MKRLPTEQVIVEIGISEVPQELIDSLQTGQAGPDQCDANLNAASDKGFDILGRTGEAKEMKRIQATINHIQK